MTRSDGGMKEAGVLVNERLSHSKEVFKTSSISVEINSRLPFIQLLRLCIIILVFVSHLTRSSFSPVFILLMKILVPGFPRTYCRVQFANLQMS